MILLCLTFIFLIITLPFWLLKSPFFLIFSPFGCFVWLIYHLYNKQYTTQKMLTELANFPRRTQEIIHEWANIVRTKYAITEDEEDVLYMGDPLLIIEWDKNGLQQRGIQKTAIINGKSKNKLTYGQRGVPTLGRMYSVVAERKGAFKVTEIHNVFSL
ncbi:hypothetical protein F8M41_000319 [Gigaspora margarita]|uniref:Uncharacterized protein n=1 Tax=Gigaspora margarita TaxID=4874 RepID=A0A8H3XGU6_GIGMA|nr:hypothetical protein F8M41_000319 [Gigaspora margarita]